MAKVSDIKEIKTQTLLFLKILEKFPDFRYLGDPILRKKTTPVNLKEGKDIGILLTKTLLNYRKTVGYGRGLAAPQVGLSKSVFVTYLNDDVQIYINPKITTKSIHGNYCRELCLSCGPLWPDVKRPETVKMEWKDIDGQTQTGEFSGLEARLIQHEYDHLCGIPNIDRAERGTIEFCTSDPLKEKIRNNVGE